MGFLKRCMYAPTQLAPDLAAVSRVLRQTLTDRAYRAVDGDSLALLVVAQAIAKFSADPASWPRFLARKAMWAAEHAARYFAAQRRPDLDFAGSTYDLEPGNKYHQTSQELRV
ncbi:hypothetical protein DRQ53_12030 [bacterium]|nr:MAG: hypothetical protein DRQ53_12030 [bacterium]